jgi:hypothetical protein
VLIGNLLSLLLRGRRLRSEGSDGRRGDLELLAEGENQTMSGVFSVALDGRCGEDDYWIRVLICR